VRNQDLKRSIKIRYFCIAFVMYFLFRYLIGPQLGCTDIVLTLGSYGFAILVATAYLYKAIFIKSQQE
jgi:hypothetical protein